MFEILRADDISALCGGKYTTENGFEAVDLLLDGEKSGFCVYQIAENVLYFKELEYPACDPVLGDALLRAVLNIALNNRASTANFDNISENPAALRYGCSGAFDIAEFFEKNNCRGGC